MKRCCLFLLGSFLALSASADPVKALLIVQNHADEQFRKPLSNLATRLSTALSGDMFEIVDPNDAVGENQNRSPRGENMPLSAATRLAEHLGADALITASIDDISEISTAGAVKQLSVTMTLQAKRVPSGGAVGGVEINILSRKYTNTEYANNSRAFYSQLISQICRSASEQFLSKVAGVKWNRDPGKVMVAFGCNYPGADVSIDGVSYGTAGVPGGAPLQVPVSPGVHNLTVSYPFAHPYKVQANFMANSTYLITLTETDEGRHRRKDDAYFAQLLDRAARSGATDDFCRSERAKGYAKYLSSSHIRIEGMPQVLAKWNCGRVTESSPELGLKSDQGDAKVESTEAILRKAAESLGVGSK